MSRVQRGTIQIQCPKEEVVAAEKGERHILEAQNDGEWEDCKSDESEKSNYQYDHIEGNGVLKRVKRPKKSADSQKVSDVVSEPIHYKEWQLWYTQDSEIPKCTETVSDRLLALENVVPMGYAFE